SHCHSRPAGRGVLSSAGGPRGGGQRELVSRPRRRQPVVARRRTFCMAATIREYSAADYERVAALWQASGIRVESEEDLRLKLRRDPDLFLVAEEEGDVVGALLGAFDGRIGSLNRLAVAESQRRGGLATRLVSAVEERLAAKGARRVWAWIE